MEDRKLDADEIAEAIAGAIEGNLSFSLNIHGIDSVETAIDLAERILGPGGRATINQQPSCFVIGAREGKGDVSFFVSKNPFS